MKRDWYLLSNIDEIDSPALVIYKERVVQNIITLVNSIDNVQRLRPHIKTHKSPFVTKLMIDHGIRKFKCATIAEAEMLITAGATEILLAYQPVGPKAKRFVELCKRFPDARLSCLIDNFESATALAAICSEHSKPAYIYIDLNVGMNRTGIWPQDAPALIEFCSRLQSLVVVGLHAYDGHIRDEDFETRKTRSDNAFKNVEAVASEMRSKLGLELVIVAGGTPTYSVHKLRPQVECSPGTFIYWDKGYEKILKEQNYLHAAVVVSRVISKPAPGLICIDLGHKSIASENPIDQRIVFLNASDVHPVGHSEEHMVLKTDNETYQVGDVFYGVPFHVCPTIALYERSAVAEKGAVRDWWLTLSRNRRITV